MRSAWPRGVGLYGILGMLLVVAGGFLPWITHGTQSINAWGLEALPILPWFRSAGGPPIGPFLLVVLVLLVPYVTRRPLPAVVRLLVAAIAFNLAGGVIVTILHAGAGASLGIGVLLTLAGSVLVVVGDGGAAREARMADG
ncbi:MAG: hypothetical protein QOE92_69 [Chloroflexota bacterium]|jgi:hypothetical protein|nr:hypothetical protein [Chloroflexota bacterium]